MRSTILIAVALLLGGTTVTLAQEPAEGERASEVDLTALRERVRPGDEIRFTVAHSREWLTGWLAGFSHDTLVIRTNGRKFLGFAMEGVDDLEVKRHGGATTGMVVGGLLGVGAGIGYAINNVEQDCNEGFMPVACDAGNVLVYLTPLALLVAGGLLGRTIGGLIAPERWEPVPLGELSVSPMANGGLGLTMMITLAPGRRSSGPVSESRGSR